MNQKLPSIVIVGRPNVGKSTLFNRLTGTRRSIVTDEPGITRDRIYGPAIWRGRPFELVDTGGLLPNDKAAIPREILRQAQTAIADATTLVLVVDARAGVTPLDLELAAPDAADGQTLCGRREQGGHDTAGGPRRAVLRNRRWMFFLFRRNTVMALTFFSTL